METSERSFDAVAFMRSARESLAREWENLSYEEQRRYLDEHAPEDPRLRRFGDLGKADQHIGVGHPSRVSGP